jgi:ankyrin repeat protein
MSYIIPLILFACTYICSAQEFNFKGYHDLKDHIKSGIFTVDTLTRISVDDAHISVKMLHLACHHACIDSIHYLISQGADINDSQNSAHVTPLLIACYNNALDIVKTLIAYGADPSKPNIHGWTPLHIACTNGKYNIAYELIASQARVNSHTVMNDASPLLIACQEGYLDIVRLLISHGADIHKKTTNGVSPLFMACQEGHIYIVDELIQAGAYVNICHKNGSSPLITACSKGHLPIVQKLISHYAYINEQNIDGTSALFIACQNGHIDTVKELLKAYAHIHIRKINGWTPLHIACFQGHIDIVKVLLSSGACANMLTFRNESALHLASQNNYRHIIKELIAHDVHIDQENVDGYTALDTASCLNNIDSIKELVESGAQVNKTYRQGIWSPLIFASQGGHIDTLIYLIASGSHINYHTKYGLCALFIASQNGHLHIVKELIKHGADVAMSTPAGYTSLHTACQYGHTQIVEKLITSGADIHKESDYGLTPLILACRHHNVDIAQKLIAHGAHITRRNIFGNSALDVACDVDHFCIIRLLLQHTKSLHGIPIPDKTIQHAQNSQCNNQDALHTQSLHIPYAYIMAFKGADTTSIQRSHFTEYVDRCNRIDKKYPQGSASYDNICHMIPAQYHDVYILKLCIEGHYTSALRMIEGKGMCLGYKDSGALRQYIIRYVCRHITPFLVLTRNEMHLFVKELYTYKKTSWDKDQIYISMLIEYLGDIHNDIFIDASIDICSNNINNTHLSIPTHIPHTPHAYISLLEKAIWLDKEDIVQKLLQYEHINIDTIYRFYDMCRKKRISCNELYQKYTHPRNKKYAGWIFSLKHYRDVTPKVWIHTQKLSESDAKPKEPYKCVKIGKRKKMKNYLHKRLKNRLYKHKVSDHIRKQYGYISFRPLPQEISHMIASYIDIPANISHLKK